MDTARRVARHNVVLSCVLIISALCGAAQEAPQDFLSLVGRGATRLDTTYMNPNNPGMPPRPGDTFGAAIVSLGDVNGDRFSDFAATEFMRDTVASFVGGGVVSVVFGSSAVPAVLFVSNTTDARQLTTLIGEAPQGFFGSSVGSSDVDCDGIPDVIVGAYQAAAPSGAISSGRIYVIFGRNGTWEAALYSEHLGQDGFIIFSSHGYEYFGSSVSGVGDVNGDRCGDFVILRPGAAGGAEVDLVFGHKRPWAASTDIEDLIGHGASRLTTASAMSMSSIGAVAGAGDVNADGFDDIAVGAEFSTPSGLLSAAGQVFLIFGHGGNWLTPISISNAASLPTGITFSGVEANARMGASVGSAGDINGDGVGDIIFSARTQFTAETMETYVVFGTANDSLWPSGNLDAALDGTNGLRISAKSSQKCLDQECYAFVLLCGGGGDFNGDLVDDTVATSPFLGVILFGRKTEWPPVLHVSDFNGTYGLAFQDSDSLFQLSGIMGGDFNGDTLADTLFGSTLTSADNGHSYIVYGNLSAHFEQPQSPSISSVMISSASVPEDTPLSVSSHPASSGEVPNGGQGTSVVIAIAVSVPAGCILLLGATAIAVFVLLRRSRHTPSSSNVSSSTSSAVNMSLVSNVPQSSDKNCANPAPPFTQQVPQSWVEQVETYGEVPQSWLNSTQPNLDLPDKV